MTHWPNAYPEFCHKSRIRARSAMACWNTLIRRLAISVHIITISEMFSTSSTCSNCSRLHGSQSLTQTQEGIVCPLDHGSGVKRHEKLVCQMKSGADLANVSFQAIQGPPSSVAITYLACAHVLDNGPTWADMGRQQAV